MRREYSSGSRWSIWQWKDIHWQGELYLRRLHILQTPLFSILVHWIMQPDKQEHLHDHPVSMLSIILRGWYWEDTDEPGFANLFGFPVTRLCQFVNWIPSRKQHRIVAISPGGCITLCICGPREREWGFHTDGGFIPWQDYHRKFGGGTT